MSHDFYTNLVEKGLQQSPLTLDECRQVLMSPNVELLPLLNAAFQVRKHFTGKSVKIHILNNAQNGFCPEDCNYCAQAKTSKAEIEEYPLKSEAEMIAEAKRAYEGGAFRYCMVFAGRGPSNDRVNKLAGIVKNIKSQFPKLQICVSPGLLDQEKAKVLKEAGVDRLNHNLNTSEEQYEKICTTHTYQDRLNTLQAAQSVGLEVCSGMITGMGETPGEVIEVAQRLREVGAKSIPVNFLVPIPGNVLTEPKNLSPEYCLRILCLFRFLNPDAEIRAAAGREGHLRSLEVMCLYPANSIFLEGYLNTKGKDSQRVLQMIKDAGFTIESDKSLEELMSKTSTATSTEFSVDGSQSFLKTLSDLRPDSH
jgi:biotin synthase